MNKIRWKTMNRLGCENLYEISNIGGVRGKDGTVYKTTPHCRDRYPFVRLYDNFGVRRFFYVHVLMGNTWLKKPKEKKRWVVNHKDFNRENNKVGNLEWITHKQNIEHAKNGGRFNLAQTPFYGKHITSGKIIKFKSTNDSNKKGFYGSNIMLCIEGRKTDYKDYTWHLDKTSEYTK